MIEILMVALGGGLGSAVRYLTASRWDGDLPWGTLGVNVVGSAVLGAVVGSGVGDGAVLLLGVGFAGGLTTYSAFAVQTQARGWRKGTTYAALTVTLSFAACALGYLIAAAG